MSDSDQTILAHDFEVLLRYAAVQKVMLTPKQQRKKDWVGSKTQRLQAADFE